MSKPFSEHERTAFSALLKVVDASQADLGVSVGKLENGGSPLSRSYVSQVLGGGRGSDNIDVAERFRRGASVLAEAFLKGSGPLTVRKVQDFLHDFRRGLTDEQLADERVKGLLERLAALSPEPPKSFYVPTGALPDDARNRIETTALRDAVRHATSQPHFNLHVSGPRFSGTSTILNAIVSEVRRKTPETQVCHFRVPSIPFSAGFRARLEDEPLPQHTDLENERIFKTISQLQGDIAAAWRGLSVPAKTATTIQELNRWLSPISEGSRVSRLILIDALDPTSTALTLELLELIALLNYWRRSTGAFSIALGIRHRADLLAQMGPEILTVSAQLGDWKKVKTQKFGEDDVSALVNSLVMETEKVEALRRLLKQDDVWMNGHPGLIHAVAHWQAQRLDTLPVSEVQSLAEALKAQKLGPDALPGGVTELRRHIFDTTKGLNIEVERWMPDKGLYQSPADFLKDKKPLFRNFLQCADILDSTGTRWVWDELMKLHWPA